MHRRHFLHLALGAASAVPVLKARGQTTLLVRKDISTLHPNSPDLQSFIAGVGVLRESNQWPALAEIHNNQCAHANWYFFPWHRPYLLYFERLIRTVTGHKTFALPYWNWTNDPEVPAAFCDPGGPLCDRTRKVKAGDKIPGGSVDPLTMRLIMGEGNTTRFMGSRSTDQWDRQTMGALEATPHNNIHNWISGDMADFMSPLDPIFWLHHGNIDRIWKVWLSKGQNPTSANWLNYQLEYGSFTWAVNDTLTTEAMGYRYDSETDV